MDNAKQSSHLGVGLMAGAILGMATGLFLKSRKGKDLTKDAQKKALQLEGQVIKKLKDAKHLSKEKYEEIVDHVMGYYSKTKELSAKEAPEVRKFLMARWKAIDKYVKDLKEE
ncbi:MAG: YtxH domain-containing protein [bacterium]|nr:YtxH domain-containing protein [bacterium]